MINFYFDYISQPSRTVLTFLLISKIPFKPHQVRIAKLQHLSESYQKINPAKKVPTIYLQQDKLSLGQSPAIMIYLSRKYNLDSRWYGDNLLQRAKIEEYLHYHHNNTRKCAMLLYLQVFGKLYPTQQSLPSTEKIRQQIKNIMLYINQQYFKNGPYLCGKSLSLADLLAYFQIQSLIVVDFQLKQYKNIVSWMKKMEGIPEVKEANEKFMKLLPKIKGNGAKL